MRYVKLLIAAFIVNRTYPAGAIVGVDARMLAHLEETGHGVEDAGPPFDPSASGPVAPERRGIIPELAEIVPPEVQLSVAQEVQASVAQAVPASKGKGKGKGGKGARHAP